MNTIVAEFVGGPLDGQVCALPEPLTVWRVPCSPAVSLYARERPLELVFPQEFHYRRSDRIAAGEGPKRVERWLYRLDDGRGVPA